MKQDRPINVLIVDDEEPVRKFVDRVMRDAGFTTAQACDGAEALDVASKVGTVDLLVTDVMMPQMLGDELARRLRQSEPAVKVLYLTGYSDRLFKEKVTLWADERGLVTGDVRKAYVWSTATMAPVWGSLDDAIDAHATVAYKPLGGGWWLEVVREDTDD